MRLKWIMAAAAGFAFIIIPNTLPAHAGQVTWGQSETERTLHTTSVGPDAECDFSNLQDAMDAAEAGATAPHIGIHVDYEFSENYLITDPFSWPLDPWILGGFESCDEVGASQDPDHTSRTTLDAGGSGRVFHVNAIGDEQDPFRRVILDRLILTGGDIPGTGGGIRVRGRQGPVSVELRNVEVSGNSANHGGGVYVMTADNSLQDQAPLEPLLFIDNDSWVIENEAAFNGGGVRCHSSHSNVGGQVLRTGSGVIADNEAENGGGVAIHGCSAVLRNGEPFIFLAPLGGIAANTASERGGGVHVSDGATVSISSHFDEDHGGHPESAALVMLNEARRGAGIYATDEDTGVFMFRSAVLNNTAAEVDDDGGFGGGIYVNQQAQVTYLPLDGDGGCQPSISDSGVITFQPCNRLQGNSAQISGGGAFVANAASLTVAKGEVRDNQATNNGAAVFARNAGAGSDDPRSEVILESSLVTGNEGSRILYARDGGHLQTRWSTVVDNPYTGSLFRTFAPDNTFSRIEIRSSIVWDDEATDGLLTRGGDGSTTAVADCVIGFEEVDSTELTNDNFYSLIDPEFRDPDEDNFRLSLTSPAINYCDDFNDPPERDKDNRIREFEFPDETTDAPNSVSDGIYDLGAYVAYPDEIFRDRFEAD